MDIVAELEIDRLRVENEKLKSEIKKLKKEKANSSWQYENFVHVDPMWGMTDGHVDKVINLLK